MKKTLLTLFALLLFISAYANPSITQFTISDLSGNGEFIRQSNNPQNFTARFTVMRGVVPGGTSWESISCSITIVLLDKNSKEKKELSTQYAFITDENSSNYTNKSLSCAIAQNDIQPGDKIGIKIKYYDSSNKAVTEISTTTYKIQEPGDPNSGGNPGPPVPGPNGTIGIYSWRWKHGGGANCLQPYKDAFLANWDLNRLEFYAYSTSKPGTSPIYIFKGKDEGERSNYVYESDREQNSFWQYQTIKFYAYTTHVDGTVPIYRYSTSQAKDYYYSAQDNNIGLGSYVKVIAFYAFPPYKELLDLPPSAPDVRNLGERGKPATGEPTPGPRPDRGGGGRGGRN